MEPTDRPLFIAATTRLSNGTQQANMAPMKSSHPAVSKINPHSFTNHSFGMSQSNQPFPTVTKVAPHPFSVKKDENNEKQQKIKNLFEAAQHRN